MLEPEDTPSAGSPVQQDPSRLVFGLALVSGVVLIAAGAWILSSRGAIPRARLSIAQPWLSVGAVVWGVLASGAALVVRSRLRAGGREGARDPLAARRAVFLGMALAESGCLLAIVAMLLEQTLVPGVAGLLVSLAVLVLLAVSP